MRRRRILGENAFDEAGAGNDDIERAFLIFHRLIKPVEVSEIGDITLHGRHVAADFGSGLVELALAAAHDEHVGALLDELFGSGKPDTARAAGDDCDFSIQFGHDTILMFCDVL